MDRRGARRRPHERRIPRARGDGPGDGWNLYLDAMVFPAHAGMDRVAGFFFAFYPRIPRARGDGPNSSTSSDTRAAVFPAHAGMDRLRG